MGSLTAKKQMQKLPTNIRKLPSVTGHFNRLLHVIRKPIATPENVDPAEGTMSQIPDLVALCRRTAWKNMGTLKRMAFTTIAARKLLTMRFARAEFVTIPSGMMGLLARYSVQMKRGVLIMKLTSAPITIGCVHGYTLPPRFCLDS